MTIFDQVKNYDNLPFHGVILPDIVISDEDKIKIGCKIGCSNLEFITELCRHGFKEKIKNIIPKEQHQEYIDRIKFELDSINALGFINYILMVWDICQFAHNQGITIGPGRGSVGASLICYLIGITKHVDPIKYNLFFARFLSKSRAKSTIVNGIKYIDGGLAPDIDLDFCYYRRQEVINYINKKYEGKTSKLLTTTTFTSKVLMKDVLKSYQEVTEDEANYVSDLIEREFGIPQEIEDALSDDPKKENANFKKWYNANLLNKEATDLASKLSGLERNRGCHASAILICHDKIDDLIPLQLSSDKETVSGYDMYSVQDILLKFDILGLKTLSVINDACKLIGINADDIDINHPSIYKYLENFKYRYGIFQFESFAQGNIAVKIKPANFEQIAAALAISRPGASANLQKYLDYIHHGKYNSVHPLIDDILKPTGGVALFQETMLSMLVRVGLTPDESENIRKILSKKLIDKVADAKAKIEEVCFRNNHPKEIVDLLIKIANDSAGYAFSKIHASFYSIITCQTLYLKANYPLQYYLALLKMAHNESDSQSEIAIIQTEMNNQGFTLLPPDLSKSCIDFSIEGNSIRFALNSIKGVSDKNIEKLETFKTGISNDKFEIFEALKTAKLNIGIGSSLIQAGCLSSFGSRSKLVLELQSWNILTIKEKKLCMNLKLRFKDDLLNIIDYLRNSLDEKGKPYIKESRFATFKAKYDQYKEIFNINSKNEKLANYWYERAVLGYSYSENLQDIFKDKIMNLMGVKYASEEPEENHIRAIGFVKDLYKSKTKKGSDCFSFSLYDETGELKVKMFNDKIARIELTNGRELVEEDLVIIEGTKKEGNMMFGNNIGIQTAKIYMKLSQLKKDKEQGSELLEDI